MGADAARLKRLMEIRGWLLGLRVCAFCSLRKALLQVEREMGDRTWEAHGYECRLVGFNGRTCQGIIDENWSELAEATLWARTAELMVKDLSGDASLPIKTAPSGSSSVSVTEKAHATRPRGGARFGSRSSGGGG